MSWQVCKWQRERNAESGCSGRPRWKCLSSDICISISSEGEDHDIEWRWHCVMCSSQVNDYMFLSSLPLLPSNRLLVLLSLCPLIQFLSLRVYDHYILFFSFTLKGLSTSPLAQSYIIFYKIILSSVCKNKFLLLLLNLKPQTLLCVFCTLVVSVLL